MQYLRLIEQLVTTLALEDPAEALAEAIRHLGEAGLSLGEPTDDRAAWLTLTHGGRTLALHGAVPPDDTLRPILAGLLHGTLVRLAEHDEYRRARERMEMLSTASFEGILVHVDGVTVDANDRLAEMLGYERQELIGMPVVEVCVAPEERAAVLHRVKE
ncbi:MAG: PAS domain-containing protein, partial [Proteobacteria bacterium]|nr:PAS domain-containing protein [Pseudomonadota bacterium]